MRKKKLLFRNRSLEVGGVESVLLTILNHIDRSKFEIVLLLNYAQGEFLDRVPNDVKLISIGEGSQSLSKYKFINIVQKIFRRFKYYKFQKNPSEFYRENNLLDVDYEIAFSHYMIDDVLNSPNQESKKIFWIHSNLVNSGMNDDQNRLLVNKLLEFDKGVFVSYHSKNIVEKTWNIKLDNSIVIHNPIEVEDILTKSKEDVENQYKQIDFLGIGRLFEHKGFKEFILAVSQLVGEGYNPKVLIIGDGSQKEELKDIITKERLEHNVVLYGYSNNPIKYMRNTKFFVLPSFTEGYPIVVLEALLLGKYVLATDVGGVSEMVNERNGILFKPGKENIYKAMKYVLDKPSNHQNISNYLDLVKKNDEIFNQIEDLF